MQIYLSPILPHYGYKAKLSTTVVPLSRQEQRVSAHITHIKFSFHLSLLRLSETLWFLCDNGTTVFERFILVIQIRIQVPMDSVDVGFTTYVRVIITEPESSFPCFIQELACPRLLDFRDPGFVREQRELLP